MASMIRTTRFSLTSKSTQIRDVLEEYTPWISSCTGNQGADLVQIRFDQPLAGLASRYLLGPCQVGIQNQVHSSLESRLKRIEFPPGVLPAAALRLVSLRRIFTEWWAEWLDCPVALFFCGLSRRLIVAKIPVVDGASHHSEWREVSIARREDLPALLQLLQEHLQGHNVLKVMGERSVDIQPLLWDELVFDESVALLIKHDFELFLNREDWYRRHGLLYRRGYLLHGPPGNGKTSVIRAMLSTAGISGFTLNPFRVFSDDDVFAAMFAEAAQYRPSLIILEDLDRWFSEAKEGDCGCRITLQQLLNHLDGVGNQNGIVVVATANNPSTLDPAILRRPGRFDRVVRFQNPNAELRGRYLQQLSGDSHLGGLEQCIKMTAGFSFSQLRETYVLAGQLTLEDGREDVNAQYICQAAEILAHTMVAADRKWHSQLGFREAQMQAG